MKIKLLLVLSAVILFTTAYSSNSLFLKSGTYHLENHKHATTIVAPQKSEIVSGFFYRIISFDNIPTQIEKEALQDAGLEFLNYLPKNSYLVAVPLNHSAISNQLSKLRVQAIFKMPASFKIDDRIYDPSSVGYAYINDNEVKVNIQYHKNIDPATARELLAKEELVITDRIDAVNVLIAQTSLSNLEDLAKLDYINFIEPISDPGQHDDEQARSLHRSNVLNAAYSAGRKYDGAGLHAVINDDGAVGPHIDYTGRLTNYSTAGGGTHGDGTAGCLGAVGNLDPTKSAGATGVQLYIWDYTANMNNTMTSYNNDSCRIISTSYSNGCNAGYTAVTQLVDREISNNTDLLQVFSAGNSNNQDCGYGAGDQWGNVTGGHKIAKNCIATANLFYDDGLVPSSSRGPAEDGRIKPDLAAHGQNQQATAPNNAYMNFGGTSAAAPSLAGIATQLYDAYWDLNGGLPESGLIKAVMMNSADDLGNIGPDFIYGWGRINGRKAVEILENNQYLDATVSQGGGNTHNITVPASVAEVRFMLYWMDPEAAIGSGPSLVNDLNLTVTDPSSNNLLPLVLDETPNPITLDLPAVPGVDDLNNVEQVRVTSPAAGSYTVNVSGFAVPMGPQKYYVVYEFIYDDITVIYPQGGEGFSPGETEAIRWDAYGTAGTFDIEYSDDNGATWNNVTTGILGDVRTFDWTVPNALTGEALVRITNGGKVAVSPEEFSIIRVPVNLSFPSSCGNSITMSWNAVPGATGYDCYILGQKYMEIDGSTTTTSYTYNGIDPGVGNWFAVRATGPTNAIGRRSLAVNSAGSSFEASFDASVTAPCFGSSVRFSNTSTGGATNYTWMFSPSTVNYVGGTNMNSPNPQVIFPTTSSYTVTLISSNMVCTDTLVIPNLITPVNPLTLPLSEDFESYALCGTDNDCQVTSCPIGGTWFNQTNNSVDDIDWRVHEGPTPTFVSGANTGPIIDHKPGTSTGNYIYLEASGGCNNFEAHLVSQCIDLSAAVTPELTVWFHMWGSAIGQLSVDVNVGGIWTNDIVAPVVGDRGNVWRRLLVDLSPYNGDVIYLRLRGSTGFNAGSNFEGDMALDNINIVDSSAVSVNDVSTFNINLYPNPNNGEFTVTMPQSVFGNVLFEVFDIAGKLVYNKTVSVNQNNVEFNLKNLSSGSYIIKGSIDNDVSYQKLLIE